MTRPLPQVICSISALWQRNAVTPCTTTRTNGRCSAWTSAGAWPMLDAALKQVRNWLVLHFKKSKVQELGHERPANSLQSLSAGSNVTRLRKTQKHLLCACIENHLSGVRRAFNRPLTRHRSIVASRFLLYLSALFKNVKVQPADGFVWMWRGFKFLLFWYKTAEKARSRRVLWVNWTVRGFQFSTVCSLKETINWFMLEQIRLHSLLSWLLLFSLRMVNETPRTKLGNLFRRPETPEHVKLLTAAVESAELCQ